MLDVSYGTMDGWLWPSIRWGRWMDPARGVLRGARGLIFQRFEALKRVAETSRWAGGASKLFRFAWARNRGCSLRGRILRWTRKASRCEEVVVGVVWWDEGCVDEGAGGAAVSGDGGG